MMQTIFLPLGKLPLYPNSPHGSYCMDAQGVNVIHILKPKNIFVPLFQLFGTDQAIQDGINDRADMLKKAFPMGTVYQIVVHLSRGMWAGGLICTTENISVPNLLAGSVPLDYSDDPEMTVTMVPPNPTQLSDSTLEKFNNIVDVLGRRLYIH
jgi:hypothetical protein